MAFPRRERGGRRPDDELRVYVAARVERWNDHLIWLNSPSHRDRRRTTPVGFDGTVVISARRLVWQINYGAIPKGACVINSCGLDDCVAPNHLILRPRQTKVG